jgi:pimeloyl-ACP methyl ester carboxylesterase
MPIAVVAYGVAAVTVLLAACIYRLQLPRGPVASLPGQPPKGDEIVHLQASGGPTRYRLSPGSGRLIVLVPGISYPMELYDEMFKAIKASGRAVLMYDVTGRGYSHSSGEKMTTDLYVRQLLELLEAIGHREGEVDLVGWSMGSIIVTHFADRMPSRVARLVLLAPVGGMAPNRPWTANLIHLPMGLGPALATLVMSGTLKKLYRNELGDGRLSQFLCDHVSRNPSLTRAIVSTLADCTELDDNRKVLKSVGLHQRPVLVLWGSGDGTISRANIDAIMSLLPSAALEVFKGAGHAFFVLEVAYEANARVVDFLRD